MEFLFLGIVVFLFALAVFDLSVGVSNDAVNFLNSAIGSKAASFKTIMIIAAVGVLAGAVMSNGMMDIARHGIFRPEYFSFYELICIFMAVMVIDIILLDVFNTLGMPTSTTVSMVFELLGAAFAVAFIKTVGNDGGVSLVDLLNTEKALSVILGIFLSVALAFTFGTVVQFLARLVFSFGYRNRLKGKIGIFGGCATTAIIYFLLLKGAKDLVFMTPEVKEWIGGHTALLLGGSFVFFTLLMQLLHALKVNVLKVVVLIGTFALAMAFAGNDLVNFIGVPLSGLSAYQDFVTNGTGNPRDFMMGSLNGPADTPLYFLVVAGLIMVVSLATSSKARNVTKTEIGLGSQQGGEEMFGSSRIARRLVRTFLWIHTGVKSYVPQRMQAWINRRFDSSALVLEEGASFDLIRASVNLMLAGMLIAVGTSMKLPLSTTFVTFMVAMGTSLADRAWGRESAVFRITGVISVIGGWFITAGVAFIGAAIMALLMYGGGTVVMIVVALGAIALLIRSNMRFKEKQPERTDEVLFQTLLTTEDKEQTWALLKIYIAGQQKRFLEYAAEKYGEVVQAFVDDKDSLLCKTERSLVREKAVLKMARQRETLCFRRIPTDTAIAKSTWFHLSNNACVAMNYNLRRMTEVCKEHVENNFRPLPDFRREVLMPIQEQVIRLLTQASGLLDAKNAEEVARFRKECDRVKELISAECHRVYGHLQTDDAENLTVTYVYLNLLQESQELLSALRKMLRYSFKLHDDLVV